MYHCLPLYKIRGTNFVTQICYFIVRKQCDEENSIRLTEFFDDTIGRLEVCTDGIWGSVCGNGATGDIATVVCKELNHTSTGRLHTL